jgi:hypothetical protein
MIRSSTARIVLDRNRAAGGLDEVAFAADLDAVGHVARILRPITEHRDDAPDAVQERLRGRIDPGHRERTAHPRDGSPDRCRRADSAVETGERPC